MLFQSVMILLQSMVSIGDVFIDDIFMMSIIRDFMSLMPGVIANAGGKSMLSMAIVIMTMHWVELDIIIMMEEFRA
ncbi:hypothetical protein JTE90_025425 [Oedothorax gibbosus]|uniref:Uncharacterized protein n=1 Tax=Oedothorax gibbosus TaxID=931172 RepID=A0AAV6U801_9ARAC|nr:hypothetical protein JTE90_025425 [Oedothorax gibbosus]